MRQQFRNKTYWYIGCWVVLGGVAAMLLGWPAGAEPAHSVQGLSFGGLASGELLTGAGSGPMGPSNQGLISYVQTSETKETSVLLIDPVKQVMCVYHIGREDGQIQLKSVRPIAWDFSLTDYNTSKPLPEEIHKGLQRQ